MKKKSLLILGTFSTVLLIGLFFLNAYFFYRLTNHFLWKLAYPDKKENSKQIEELLKHFQIDFEQDQDLLLFEAKETGMEISKRFATRGRHSLLVEFPAGAEFPGITLETFGSKCFDWSNVEALVFDVLNVAKLEVGLTIKLKSGKKYPKSDFEKKVMLPPLKPVTIVVTRQELKNLLDLKNISYLNFHMRDPRTTFFLYIDNIRVVRSG